MKDLSKAKPREVEAYLRQVILDTFGDEVENRTSISASHGYYSVQVTLLDERYIEFSNFRKKDAGRIAKAIRALK